MLLPPKVAHGVADGSVTLAFRRWRKQDVRVGSEFRTVAGVIRVDAVDVVDDISEEEARQAGWPDVARLRKQLAKVEGDLPTYRVRLSWAGPDPRVALRESADLTDDDVAASTPSSSGSTAPAATARGRWPPSTSSGAARTPVRRTSQRRWAGSATRSRSTSAS